MGKNGNEPNHLKHSTNERDEHPRNVPKKSSDGSRHRYRARAVGGGTRSVLAYGGVPHATVRGAVIFFLSGS